MGPAQRSHVPSVAVLRSFQRMRVAQGSDEGYRRRHGTTSSPAVFTLGGAEAGYAFSRSGCGRFLRNSCNGRFHCTSRSAFGTVAFHKTIYGNKTLLSCEVPVNGVTGQLQANRAPVFEPTTLGATARITFCVPRIFKRIEYRSAGEIMVFGLRWVGFVQRLCGKRPGHSEREILGRLQK